MLPWFDWYWGEGAWQEQLPWKCLGWVWQIPAPALPPPLSQGTKERFSHQTANPAQFSTVCASSLCCSCWISCAGCAVGAGPPKQPADRRSSISHLPFWDCPGTEPGHSDHQVLSLPALQPDTSQGWAQHLQNSSWLEHLRDLPEFRDPKARDAHNGFGRLKIDLAPSSCTCNTCGCFNRCLFLTSASC